MNVAVVTLNRGRGSGIIARHQVLALLEHGHAAYLVHSGEGPGINDLVQLEDRYIGVGAGRGGPTIYVYQDPG